MANEGRIIGLAMITGSRVLLPGEVSSIDGNVTIPSVATIGTIQFANISISTIEVGTVAIVVDTSTIGTVLSGNISSSVISPLDGGRVAVNVGTIENTPPVTIAGQPVSVVALTLGTVGTIVSGNVSAGVTSPLDGGRVAVNVGTIENAPAVTIAGQPISVSALTLGTIGTITSGNISAGVISPLDNGRVAVNVGTIESAPLVTEGRYFVQTNVLGVGFTGSYSGLTVATLSAGALQDLVVDVVYGTVVVGSVQTQVLSVEPQSGIATSTITATAWYAGTLVAGQRLTASGPVGALIAVSVDAVGTVAGIYVTAEQSAGG
jgi:hypothetical protein